MKNISGSINSQPNNTWNNKQMIAFVAVSLISIILFVIGAYYL
jgi:flagellar biogenesis protein FliO